MNDIDPVELLASSAPRLSDETKRAHLALLRAEFALNQTEVPRPTPLAGRRLRRRATAIATVCLMGIGVGTAAAYVEWTKPSATDLARCFAVSNPADYENFSKSGGTFHDVQFLTRDGDGWTTQDTAAHAVEACAGSWRIGGMSATEPYLRDLDPWYVDFTGEKPAEHPVPDLVACVLYSGIVGVFPDTACAELRLPRADLSGE